MLDGDGAVVPCLTFFAFDPFVSEGFRFVEPTFEGDCVDVVLVVEVCVDAGGAIEAVLASVAAGAVRVGAG